MKKLGAIVFILFLAFFSTAQENTISVKKKTPVKKTRLEGIYYSNPMVQEIKKNRTISYKESRFFVIVSNNNKIAIFRSSLPPKKAIKKYSKKGLKMVEEYGKYTKTNNDIYFEVQSINLKQSKTYRYIARITDGNIYLNYKAAYKQKTALDIYLYKYNEPIFL